MDNKSAYHTQKNRDLILTNNFHKIFFPWSSSNVNIKQEKNTHNKRTNKSNEKFQRDKYRRNSYECTFMILSSNDNNNKITTKKKKMIKKMHAQVQI